MAKNIQEGKENINEIKKPEPPKPEPHHPHPHPHPENKQIFCFCLSDCSVGFFSLSEC